MQSSRLIKPYRRGEIPFLPITGYLVGEFPVLYAYLGDIAFDKLTRDYVQANPTKRENTRYLNENLPLYLQSYMPNQHSPEIYELASFEAALNKAFAAPDDTFLKLADFDRAASADFSRIKISFVTSAQLLSVQQNTTSIWAALKCGERPPKPHRLDQSQQVLIWRQRDAPRFRLLGEEEAMLFALLMKKASISPALKKMHHSLEKQQAMARLINYARGWVDAELVLQANDGLLK